MRIAYMFALLCAAPLAAHADLYKAVDADGHVTYSSSPLKGGKKIYLEPLPTMVPLAKARSPSDFPKVDGETQKGRDASRRKILQDELDAEQKLLETAQQKLQAAQGENNGNFVSNGKSMHNGGRAQEYEAMINSLTAEVNLHQQNIAALNTELSKLK